MKIASNNSNKLQLPPGYKEIPPESTSFVRFPVNCPVAYKGRKERNHRNVPPDYLRGMVGAVYYNYDERKFLYEVEHECDLEPGRNRALIPCHELRFDICCPITYGDEKLNGCITKIGRNDYDVMLSMGGNRFRTLWNVLSEYISYREIESPSSNVPESVIVSTSSQNIDSRCYEEETVEPPSSNQASQPNIVKLQELKVANNLDDHEPDEALTTGKPFGTDASLKENFGKYTGNCEAKGVSYVKVSGKYQASVQHKKRTCTAVYPLAADAALQYDEFVDFMKIDKTKHFQSVQEYSDAREMELKDRDLDDMGSLESAIEEAKRKAKEIVERKTAEKELAAKKQGKGMVEASIGLNTAESRIMSKSSSENRTGSVDKNSDDYKPIPRKDRRPYVGTEPTRADVPAFLSKNKKRSREDSDGPIKKRLVEQTLGKSTLANKSMIQH